MRTNEIPVSDPHDTETGCCLRFHPEAWDGQVLHFDDKPFVKAASISVFHVPLNMGAVFRRTNKKLARAHAKDTSPLVLSQERSGSSAEHLFAVTKPVPGAKMARLSGDFMLKVFEGPYRNGPRWCETMQDYAQAQGKHVENVYMYYTTCPRCAKHYGKNYVVGVAKVR